MDILCLHNLLCQKAVFPLKSMGRSDEHTRWQYCTVFQVVYFKYLLYIFALAWTQPFLNLLSRLSDSTFFPWLVVYNKKPNAVISDFREQQSQENVLLGLIVSRHRTGQVRVTPSASPSPTCSGNATQHGVDTWFGSFFFTLGRVGICCEPFGLNAVLPWGMC